MINKLALRILAILVGLTLLATACGSDDAGSVTVVDAQFRTTPNDLGAGYMTISNGTDESVTLIGASSPDVERIELHESSINDEGVMQMEQRPGGFTIEPGGEAVLEPGGKHLMLFGPTATGEELELSLDFGDEQVVVMATFDEEGSAAADQDMDSMGADDMDSMDDDS